jgi:hypothetical protein
MEHKHIIRNTFHDFQVGLISPVIHHQFQLYYIYKIIHFLSKYIIKCTQNPFFGYYILKHAELPLCYLQTFIVIFRFRQ